MTGAEDLVSVFHRVQQLLPNDQEVVVIAEDAPVVDALALMQRHEFDQLPVVAGEEVLGVFSYREFATRLMREPRLLRKGLPALVVEDFIEEVPLVRDTDRLDSVVRALRRYGTVLVGAPDALLAVMTEADLVDYLHRIAEPYLLVQEIELGVRALIASCLSDDSLRVAIVNALSKKYEADPQRIPTSLNALSFDEQVSIVVDGRNFPHLAAAFGMHVDAVALQLRPVSELRNAIFHFRRPISFDETRLLQETRNWVLRRCRKASGRAVRSSQ